MSKDNSSQSKRRTYFEWLHLVITISIPVLIGIYTVIQNNREIKIAEENRKYDLLTAEEQHKDQILRDCQQTITNLIEKYGSQLNITESASVVAHFSLMSTLDRVDSHRRSFLIYLLYDARLITYDNTTNKSIISLRSMNLTEINLVTYSLSLTLENISFIGAYMKRSNFHSMTIYALLFDQAQLQYADFSMSSNIWSGQNNHNLPLTFHEANLSRARFVEAWYHAAQFHKSFVRHANFEKFICSLCSFDLADLTNVNFYESSFENSSFTDAILSNTNFSKVNIGPYVYLNLAEMNNIYAKGIIIIKSEFVSTNLRESQLDYAKIENSLFIYGRLPSVSMKYAQIINSDFSSADLTEADWRHIQCIDCIFIQTDFTRTNLLNSTFRNCTFRDTNLTETQLKQMKFIQ